MDVINGVSVVKNPSSPIHKDDIVSITHEISIGQEKSERAYTFSVISSLSVDSDENIYVLDYKDAQIKVFNKHGHFVRSIGTKGSGPGELSSPYTISISHKNEILVQDLNNHKLLFFKPNGDLVKEISTVKIVLVGADIDPEENIVGLVSQYGPEGQQIDLIKLDTNLNEIYSFVRLSKSAKKGVYTPFASEIFWDLSNKGNVYCGDSSIYEVRVYDIDGILKRKITREFRPIEVRQNEIEEMKRSIPVSVEVDIPKYHSAFQHISTDEDGRLFVQTWEKESSAGYYYDVFDTEGKHITKILLESPPQEWKNNKLYIISEDDNGLHYIKRYKVTWKI